MFISPFNHHTGTYGTRCSRILDIEHNYNHRLADSMFCFWWSDYHKYSRLYHSLYIRHYISYYHINRHDELLRRQIRVRILNFKRSTTISTAIIYLHSFYTKSLIGNRGNYLITPYVLFNYHLIII